MRSALRGKCSIVITILLVINSIGIVTAYDENFVGKGAKEFVLKDQFSKGHTWSKFKSNPDELAKAEAAIQIINR